jgi:cardiolipin synthase
MERRLRRFAVEGRPGESAALPLSRQILMVPNLVSLLRLVGVPLFLWLFLGPPADGWAVVVLVIGGTSDWVDGFLARRLGQVSRLGELLDPLADRLYILATLLALAVRDVVPWWFAIALLTREALLALCLPVWRRYGYGPPPVHYVGKSATFVLLVAFPTLLLAAASDAAVSWAYPAGWALAWWGLVLYWIAGGFYLVQLGRVIRDTRRPSPMAGPA